MPNDYIYSPLIALANKDFSSEQLRTCAASSPLKNKSANTLNRLNECRLATCYMLRWAQAKYFLNQYRGNLQTFSQLKREEGKDSLIYLKRIEKPLTIQKHSRE